MKDKTIEPTDAFFRKGGLHLFKSGPQQVGIGIEEGKYTIAGHMQGYDFVFTTTTITAGWEKFNEIKKLIKRPDTRKDRVKQGLSSSTDVEEWECSMSGEELEDEDKEYYVNMESSMGINGTKTTIN